jgi:hypothetical protein
MSTIESFVDKYLDQLVARNLNRREGGVHPEMAGPVSDKYDNWFLWLPIPSTVTDAELAEVETRLGHPLPASYRRFLKHRHFYELTISDCIFLKHPIRGWQDELYGEVFNGYPREWLIDTGRIPFAELSDWGLLCFDTTAPVKDHDYPVVLWDHEIFDDFEYKYANFEEMLVHLDREAMTDGQE